MLSTIGLSIPEELRSLPQWICWNLEPRDGNKVAKPPYDAQTGKKASVVDPSTWATFERASKAAPLFGFDGIGFVFTQGDPYVGIDLDNCRDSQTGEVKPWAASIIKAVDSYTEISPSGKGVHIIARGKLPGNGKKIRHEDGALEMYDRGRFFVITGDVLPGATATVEERDAEVRDLYEKVFGKAKQPQQQRKTQGVVGGNVGVVGDSVGAKRRGFASIERKEIDDEEVLRRARTAANGEKFRRLFDQGDITEYGNDHSSADLALCGLLAYVTRGNGEQMDRLFRQSALMRDKWADRPDYRERTIKSAGGAMRETTQVGGEMK